MPNHYPSQCWFIIIRVLWNKLNWNLNQWCHWWKCFYLKMLFAKWWPVLFMLQSAQYANGNFVTEYVPLVIMSETGECWGLNSHLRPSLFWWPYFFHIESVVNTMRQTTTSRRFLIKLLILHHYTALPRNVQTTRDPFHWYYFTHSINHAYRYEYAGNVFSWISATVQQQFN